MFNKARKSQDNLWSNFFTLFSSSNIIGLYAYIFSNFKFKDQCKNIFVYKDPSDLWIIKIHSYTTKIIKR